MRYSAGQWKRLFAFLFFSVLMVYRAFAAETSDPNEIRLERLYTIPSIIGTPPELATWSPDAEHVAFLWNEEGYPARDIWVYSPATGNKRRLTGLDGRGETRVPERGDSIDAIQWLDDQQLLYLYQGALHFVDLAGNSRLWATLEGTAEQVKVSPDGHFVSFVSNGDLWVAEVGDGDMDANPLSRSAGEKVFVESYKWSGNGKAIALVMADDSAVPELEVRYDARGESQVHTVTRPFPGDETTARRIGLLELSDGKISWLDRPDTKDPIWGYDWSDDGRAIFVDSSDYLVRHRTITAYDARTGAGQLYYDSHDPNGKYDPAWSAAWAPDGAGLIVLSDHEGFYHLYRLPAAGAGLLPLTRGKWEVASFTVDSANSFVYFTANKDHVADRQLYRVPLKPGGKIERVSKAPGTYEPCFSPAFDDVVFEFSDDRTPSDLYHQTLADMNEVSAQRITHSPTEDFDGFQWADVRYIQFRSHIDGTTLFGRLYVPDDFDPEKKYPLIVGSVYSDTVRNQWGGRTAHPTWGLDQYFVSREYLVLSVNVRGSWGQGRAFRNSRKEFGGIDVDDIESGVRYLVSQGHVDAGRVGIWGSSYGGLMTAMSLFKKPGLYVAGIAGAPATNVWHAFPGEMRVMGEPKGDDYPGRYERQSALSYAAGLQDPLMIIHGTKDHVVLYSDSLTLSEKLIAHGKSFELVTIPGVGHYWDANSPPETLFAFKKMAEFFERHLKN